MDTGEWAVGVDLGGTKLEVAHVDTQGHVHNRILVPTDVKGGPSAILQQIVTAVRTLQQKASSIPVGIGIGVPGQVASNAGLVHFAPNLLWKEVPFGANLEHALKLPVVVTNDVRAAAWGEWRHGAGKDCDDLVCIFVGTGIGGGIVSGGNMLVGSTNTAGEIGHMVIAMNGPLCACGNRGCLESIAGGHSIAIHTQEKVKANPKAGELILEIAGGQLQAIDAKAVITAFHQKDPLAVLIIENVISALTTGTVNIVNILNPHKVIFGGGITKGIPEIVPRVAQGVKAKALAAATSALHVLSIQLTESAGSIGAAAMALEVLKK
jgi:glucokinase